MLGGDVSKITWEQFKESFYAKFFFSNVKHAKQQEFLNLEQGDMTVEQYDVEFDMLSRFAPDMVKDEAARTEKKELIRLRLQAEGQALVRRGRLIAACLGTAARPEVRRCLPAASSGAGCCRENFEGATCLWEVWESSWWSLLDREWRLLQMQETRA
ncbi:gag-protease polyprotein [Cucumis melo var. makuwa]|uniref:Gag-protease polyprotein n=1 Tax=Cucumis melo var. makuwa TaxID=1194695 RepID=A0A5D3CAV1_CUCMM|nr:gag-protease polyprotein [Cucumis melo var. makuwa]TYK08470.1 gag-protease polyprotein [Cucumis melo var. makuwa]